MFCGRPKKWVRAMEPRPKLALQQGEFQMIQPAAAHIGGEIGGVKAKINDIFA